MKRAIKWCVVPAVLAAGLLMAVPKADAGGFSFSISSGYPSYGYGGSPYGPGAACGSPYRHGGGYGPTYGIGGYGGHGGYGGGFGGGGYGGGHGGHGGGGYPRHGGFSHCGPGRW